VVYAMSPTMFALPPIADCAADIKVGEWDRQGDFVHPPSMALIQFHFQIHRIRQGTVMRSVGNANL
jgi:hypothetical protein